MDADEVNDLATILEYMLEHADTIFVREQVDGKWGSHSLAELSTKARAKQMAKFITEGVVPIRMK